jgi:phosphoadenosine phosphosulfate reductase
MWCEKCNRETKSEKCDFCGSVTVVEVPLEVYWCDECKAPIIKYVNAIDKNNCPVCDAKTTYLSADLRPVFPEERLLLEIMQDKPFAFADKSVWAFNNRYYIDGKPLIIPVKSYKNQDIKSIKIQLEKYGSQNSYVEFEKNIKSFVKLNNNRLRFNIDEAHTFIRNTSRTYPRERIVISFSGGKDSTITADLTIKALSDPTLVHIFGDTTLEFPLTNEYVDRYRENNPKSIFKIATNREQNFFDVCEDIGPPARMLRWCCSMFKTGTHSDLFG